MKPPRRFPIAKTLGFEVVALGGGEATVAFQPRARHDNAQGTLHGGVLCDIADAAMGNAFRSLLAEGEGFTTVELKISFLRPVRRQKLTARGRVLRRGRRLGFMECDVTNAQGELVARAACTCIVQPRLKTDRSS